MKEEYPSFLTPRSSPFDPLILARKTEEIVCEGGGRKYTDFYCTGVYRGISTGYTVGCNLRCVFCWVNWSRDFPLKAGKLYSPQQVCLNLTTNARKKGVAKVRISGGEPTLCPDHLIAVLDVINKTGLLFILETNGILMGSDPKYIQKLSKYKNLYIRVSLKGGTPDGFERRTGGKGEFYEYPFSAVKHLLSSGIPFHVAAMTDPRLVSRNERRALIEKLHLIGYTDYLEEEGCDPYPSTLKRLEKAGFHLQKD
jgi:uncharacterized Fe-S cluster-containing radical SAM superfamily protein